MINRKPRQCFSLLELVLAMAILAMITTLCSGILFTAHQSWTRVAESAKRRELRSGLDFVADRLLRNAVPFDWPDAEGVETPIFEGRGDSVRLTVRHGIYGDRDGGLRFLVIGAEQGRLALRYRSWPLTGAEQEAVKTEIAATGVKALRFEYAIRENHRIVWLPEFLPRESGEFPVAIRMRATLEDDVELCYLRRTSGHSRYSSLGKYRKDTIPDAE